MVQRVTIERHYDPDPDKAVKGLRRLLSMPDKKDDHPLLAGELKHELEAHDARTN